METKPTYEELEQRVQELENEAFERKQTEEALRESEERFRHAFENANTGVCLVSTDGHFIKVNNRLCEIFDYTKEKLEGMPVNDITHPEDLELSPGVFQRSISGEMDNVVYEKRYIHCKGRVVWGQISSSIVRDPEGEPLYFISHVQDITQQKLAEEALKKSEEKFSTLFQASPTYISLASLEEGRFVAVNDAFTTITGYQASEVIGRTFREIGLWPDAGDREEFIKQIEEYGSQHLQEVTLTRKDGSFIEGLWSVEKIELEGKAHLISMLVDITEKKRAEEAVRESEEKYRSMMETMDEAVYICSQDYRVEYMNPAMVKRTGWDAIGELCYKVINELDEKCPWCVHNKVQQGESFETEIVSPKDGRSYNISHSPILHEDGSISKMTIFRDITERKEADEALRESEERYRTLVEAGSRSGQAIVLVRDTDQVEAGCVFANGAASDITGYSQDELAQMSWLDIVHPLYRDSEKDRHRRRMRGEIIGDIFEITIVSKGGTEVPIELASIGTEFQGKDALVVLFRDIRDRKEAEEALRESKDNLDKAQNVAHIGSWSRDLKTDQGYWSDEMYRTLGLTPGIPEHPTHEYALSRAHPDDRDHIESMIKRAVEEKGSFEYEFRTVPINGSERIIHSRGEVECDDAGVPVRRFGINQDITETRELQAQVQESQKTQAIVTLAGGIAHNFNNALTPIIGNIDLLEMAHGQDEKTMGRLKDMKTSGLRMAQLTSQMLAYAEGGKYNSKVLSLSDFVEDTLPLIQHTLDPAVRVETDLPLDVKDVEVDGTQMQMVLSAIMANSNEAMEGPGRIRISTGNMDLDHELIKDYPGLKPGPHVCLSIEDDGKGMDEETRNRIFDPFFTTYFIGRGLGMASVYGIVRNHDGAITVDSELGRGTVVRIYLPAIPSAQARRAGPPCYRS